MSKGETLPPYVFFLRSRLFSFFLWNFCAKVNYLNRSCFVLIVRFSYEFWRQLKIVSYLMNISLEKSNDRAVK